MAPTNSETNQNPNSNKNLNQPKKNNKNKKYYVNKIININYKKEKKPKTKNSGFQTKKIVTAKKETQTNPDYFPNQPVLCDHFNKFLSYSQKSIFEVIDYFSEYDS